MRAFAAGTTVSMVVLVLAGGYTTIFLKMWQPLVPLGVVLTVLAVITIVALFLEDE